MPPSKKKELELFLIKNKGVDEFTVKELADRFGTSSSYVRDIMVDLRVRGWQVSTREGSHKEYYRFLSPAAIEQRRRDNEQ
jgi:hypothetical protein